jgi:hypothetical protein
VGTTSKQLDIRERARHSCWLLSNQLQARYALVLQMNRLFIRQIRLLARPTARPSHKWTRPGLCLAFGAAGLTHYWLASPLLQAQAEEPTSRAEDALKAFPPPTHSPPGLLSRVWRGFVTRCIEPLLTLQRFGHLVLIFLPVLLTAPVLVLELLIPHPTKTKATTRFWYRLLVLQMERAGPTFIKVDDYLGCYQI